MISAVISSDLVNCSLIKGNRGNTLITRTSYITFLVCKQQNINSQFFTARSTNLANLN